MTFTLPKPTLAHDYTVNKVEFPVQVSPKLDGLRCLAHWDGTNTTLWSRTHKPILSCNHLLPELNTLFMMWNSEAGTVLDGELFTTELSFQVLNGTVRRQYTDERSLPVKYYVFDIARDPSPLRMHAQDYRKRHAYLASKITQTFYDTSDDFKMGEYNKDTNWVTYFMPKIGLLPQIEALKAHDVEKLERHFVVDLGMEGAIVRTRTLENAKLKAFRDSGYDTEDSGHTRRSWGIQKVKSFDDMEFKIEGVFEEKDLQGNPKGRAAGFVMIDVTQLRADGTPIRFNCSGINDKMKEEVWRNPGQYVGQMATVKFFGRSDDGVPRHPNFKALRDRSEIVPSE